MIKTKSILSEILIAMRRVAVCGVLASMTLPAVAADNGCNNEDNDRIVAELALCSTHAYNTGLTQNPTDATEKQLMHDVVALKTTVITQQMKKQYDYLDATLRRFKTQLEKAVLTTKLEAAGASTSNSGSGSKSNDRNVVLSGAENCLMKTSTASGLECIQNNIRIVLNAVSSGNIGDAKRQLENDLKFAKSFSASTDSEDCQKLSANRDTVNNCAYALNISVLRAIEENASKQRQQQSGWGTR